MISARQQAFFTPTLDRTLRDTEAPSKLLGGPEALFLQSLPAALELIGVAHPHDSIEGVGRLPLGAVPAFDQKRPDLNFAVRLDTLIAPCHTSRTTISH